MTSSSISFCLAEIPVEIVRPPQDVFEPPGSDVVFEVELNKDRVEVKWLRNNMTVVQGDKYQMVSEGKVHRLQVCEIRPRDQGDYRIIAKDKDAKAKLELAGKSSEIKKSDAVGFRSGAIRNSDLLQPNKESYPAFTYCTCTNTLC